MYGLVNKAIVNLIKQEFGENVWEQIRQKTNTPNSFLTNEPYDDSITYSLVAATSEILKIPPDKILFQFGLYWVNVTSKEEYPELMEACGSNLKEFFLNLPNFHTRVSLLYPNLSPPEFNVVVNEDNSILLHYYSDRPGLKNFVLGLIHGLAQFYKTEIKVEEQLSRDNGDDHESFKIIWLS